MANTVSPTNPSPPTPPTNQDDVREKVPRKCYSQTELLHLSEASPSRTCPGVLQLEKAQDIPWLMRIIPGPHQETVNLDRGPQPGGQEDRYRERGGADPVSLVPQRRNFNTGCQPTGLSPQKSRNNPAAPAKDFPIVRDFRDLESRESFRETRPDNNSNGITITRNNNNSSREFVNTRLQGNQNQRYGYNNNNNSSNDRNFGGLNRQYPDRSGFGRDRFNRERDGRDFDRPRRDRTDSSTYHDEENDAPEWMTEATSQNDFIELRGFDDDVRQDEKKESDDGGMQEDILSSQNENEIAKVAMTSGSASGANGDGKHVCRDDTEAADYVQEHKDSFPRQDLEPPKQSNQNSFTGRSRFSALFAGGEAEGANPVVTTADKDSSIQFQASAEPPADAPFQHHPPNHLHPQEAGRSLLQMLQRNDPPTHAVPLAAPPPAQPKFKTLEDIEQEQQQLHPAQTGQGDGVFRGGIAAVAAHQPHLAHVHESLNSGQPMQQQNAHFSHPSSPLHFLGMGSPQRAMYSPQPVAPSPLSGALQVDLNMIGIPDDPSLHRLLSRSNQELTSMRESGHFDHNTLLTLIQMKQRKDNLMKLMAYQSVNQQQHAAGLAHMPVPVRPFPGQQQQPLAQQHVRFANGHISSPGIRMPGFPPGSIFHQPPPQMQYPGMQYPGMRQMNLPCVQPPQQQNVDLGNMWRFNPVNIPFASSGHTLEELRMPEPQRSTGTPRPFMAASGSRPSPLLPTSVMRKTVQRGDSMNSTSSSGEVSSPSYRQSPASQQQYISARSLIDDENQQFLNLQRQEQAMRAGILPRPYFNQPVHVNSRLPGDYPSVNGGFPYSMSGNGQNESVMEMNYGHQQRN